MLSLSPGYMEERSSKETIQRRGGMKIKPRPVCELTGDIPNLGSQGRHPGGSNFLFRRSKRNQSGRQKRRAFQTQGVAYAKAW